MQELIAPAFAVYYRLKLLGLTTNPSLVAADFKRPSKQRIVNLSGSSWEPTKAAPN